MDEMMTRVVKRQGFGNIQLERIPIPRLGARDVLVRTESTLISRGSELFARYAKEEAVPPEIMGYSLTGVVERLGADVTEFAVGQRVLVVAAHAEFAVGNVDVAFGRGQMVPLPDAISFEEGTFLPLATSAVAWADSSGAKPGDTIVILGQGLVGSLMLQVYREFDPDRIIAIDALPLRCRLATDFGADHVVNASEEDPVEAVRRLTDGRGADLVVDCVGGRAGIRSFEQAQQMVRPRGTLQLIALYQGEPLPLHSKWIMNRRLVAGIVTEEPRTITFQRAIEKMCSGVFRPAPMVTHRFPFTEAKDAFDLLWNRPGEALGVLLTWRS